MPMSAPRKCTNPRCAALHRGGGRCPACRKEVERKRGSPTARGYDYEWTKARKQFLVENPVCSCGPSCCPKGCGQQATVVDHMIPHKGNMKLFWNQANWQPRAKECHDRKTATTDGGFGR
jgi:5-methylcytosine-specific restriction protein A